MNRTLFYASLSDATFLATVTTCIALRPSDIFSHDGLSFYGNYKATIWPFGLGLAATAYLLLRAASTIHKTHATRSFRIALEVIAIGLLGIIATPSFTHVKTVQDLHVIFGFLIFVTQTIVSLYYLGRQGRHTFDWALLWIQMIAIIMAFLSFHSVAVVDLMLPSQILATVAFGTLLIRAVLRHAELHTSSET
jgi:hypothetical protein